MALFGYGKTLDVNLSTGREEKKDTDARFARDLVGAMGFGGKILYDEAGVSATRANG